MTVYEVGDRVIVNSALAWANVTAVGIGGRYRLRFADGHEVTRDWHELSGEPGDKTTATDLTPNKPKMKFWRIDDQRTGETIVIEAESSYAAIREFLICCSENILTQEATAVDIENYGPGSGRGWYQD